MATRSLAFITTKTEGVSVNTSIILSFAPVDAAELYSSQLPVVWKLLKFSANQTQTISITYTARLGVAVAQVDGGVVQVPQTFVETGLGQTTSFTIDPDGFAMWSEPAPKPAPGKGEIIAVNNSGSKQDFMLGTVAGTNSFQPVMVWKGINSFDSMAASFSPKLRAYAYQDYAESAVIKAQIITGLLGEWDLSQLYASPRINTFHVFEDKDNGGKLTIQCDNLASLS